jgi:antitoxin (DNA-binding transcriptional repressor) of toxin-antitoxin stability system
MKVVGTKMLKDNLSKYLRMVREGETILVADRDEVIAEIHRPVHPVAGKVSRWEAFLNEETRKGSLTRARSAQPPALAKLLKLPRPKIPIAIAELFDALKAD